MVSVKKVFLNIMQNSQENNCAGASAFNKVSDFRPATVLKKRDSGVGVFLWLLKKVFKNTFFVRTPPVSVSS